MQTLKINKETGRMLVTNEIGGIVYTTTWRPYEVGNTPNNFGCIDYQDTPGVEEWINYKGLTYVQE
jgi:hypothetical protein